MFRFSMDQEFIPNNYPVPLHAVEPVGLQGYVFFGINSSLPEISSKRRNFNLDNLPTTFNSSGYHFIDLVGADGHFKSPLATFLLCDPQARILDGEALLSQKNSSVTLLPSSPVNRQPKVGNISPDAANVVLGLCMMESLEFDDDSTSIRTGVLSSRVFTNDTSQNFDRSKKDPFDIGILPTDQIARNLNFFLNSGSKALSSYVKNYDIPGTDQLFLVPVQGAIQQGEQALVTSQGLMIATISVFFCATLLLSINFFYLRTWQSPPFKLETLMNEAQRDEKYVTNNSFNSTSDCSIGRCSIHRIHFTPSQTSQLVEDFYYAFSASSSWSLRSWRSLSHAPGLQSWSRYPYHWMKSGVAST